MKTSNAVKSTGLLLVVLLVSLNGFAEENTASKKPQCRISCGDLSFEMRPGDQISLGETISANPDGTDHEVFKKTNCHLLSLEVLMDDNGLTFLRVESDRPTDFGQSRMFVPSENSHAREVKSIGPVTAECIQKGGFEFTKKTKNESAVAPSANEGYLKTVVKDLFHKKKDQTVPAGQQSVK